MPKTFRVCDQSVNVYGFRVLSSGWMNRDAFMKNPVMLYNHIEAWRGSEDDILPIGKWKEMKQVSDEIHGEPDFDMEDRFASKIAGKVERGYLNAASIGIRIIETSDDPALMLPGQTRSTVTKWEMRECSIVDIPANRNAVALYDHDGNRINLKDDGSDCPVPLVQLKSNHSENKNKMELNQMSIVAGFLGLKDTATLAEMQSQISELRAKADRANALEQQLKEFQDREKAARKTQAETLLKAATDDGRINDTQRAHFVSLFEKDFDSAKVILEGLPKQVKLSEVPAGSDAGGSNGTAKFKGKTYGELEKDDPNALAELKEKNFELFKQMYKDHTGTEYKIYK